MTNKTQKEISNNRGWLFLFGFLFIVLGVVALSVPVTSTVSLTFALAAVLLARGIIQFFNAVKQRHNQGIAMRFVESVLSIAVGALMLRYPSSGILGIAFALSFYFFINAAVQWVIAYARRPDPGWAWIMASSILSFLFGASMVLTFPFSAFWVPGALLGVELIFSGSMLIGFTIATRRVPQGRNDTPLKTSEAT